MKFLLLISIFIFSNLVFAQEKLVVEYESRMEFDVEAFEKNMDFGDVKVAKDEILNALKESMTRPSYYSLALTQDESEFKYVEKITNEQPSEGRVRIEMSSGGRGTTYKSLKENISLRTEDSYNKNFIIRDSIKNYDWKISRESKEILGYEVRKAETVMDSTKNVTAWYAPKLPYKNGPAEYQGLPGLILEIEIADNSDDEKRKYIFKAISLNVDSKKEKIERPKKGKEVSVKEFDNFLKEQSDKWNEMHAGGVDKD